MRARWAMLAAAVSVAGILAATGWLAPASARRPAAGPSDCVVLQVENQHVGAPSALRRLSMPSGATENLTEVGFWLNAMGYSAGQDVVYAVSDGDRAGRYHDGAHAVRVDRDGTATDLGVVGQAGSHHPAWSLITGATAGAIAGNSWYVRQDSDLYTVDVDPASADYLRVVHRTPLRLVSLAVGIDDFAFDPADGLLYGVSMSSRGDGAVVTIDPASGRIAIVPGLKFPRANAYGSVVLGPDNALYATANRIGNRSVTYRLPRDGSGPAVEVATGPALVSADAAGCLAAPAPPEPTESSRTPPPTELPPTTVTSEPQPTPTTSEVPPVPPAPPAPPRSETPTARPPAPRPPFVPPPVEQPTAPPPVTPSPTPTPTATSAPVVVAPSSHRKPPTPEPVVVKAEHAAQTRQQRRWGLTALILVLGGGAAMAHIRRHR